MRCVAATIVVLSRVFSGRCFVRVGCYVSLLFVEVECSIGNMRAFDGVNDDVSIE